ncbi:MAG: hypothetical protein Q4D48_02295 [Coriobacteriales bacterium]|nr:hypothetical protein [Coriobacteriales bacterium]
MAETPSIVCSPLIIEALEQQEGRPARLEVPLTDDLYPHKSLDLFEGGLVDEKASYSFSFSFQSTMHVRSVSLCINEHDGLRMHLEQTEDALSRTYQIVATLDNYVRPFALTCGFARILITVSLECGIYLTLRSPDIIALSGEWKQDRNVSAMYEALFKIRDNQAGEWMFADYDLLAEPNAFRDESTNWSNDSIVKMVSSTETMLDLLEHCLTVDWSLGDNMQKTSLLASQTEAIAFLDELRTRLEELAQSVFEILRKLQALRDHLQAIVDANDFRYGGHASLPILPVLSLGIDYVVSWVQRIDALITRASVLADSYVALGTTYNDSDIDINQPSEQAPIGNIPTRFRLRAAMEQWRQFTGFTLSREGRALHVLKPDRIYEYYALWRLLSWLFGHGFKDDQNIPDAIARYPYDTSRFDDLYENEWRVANTYHLNDGRRRVTVYYVPVITGTPLREENGITIHRTKVTSEGERVLSTSFYTPDYLLIIDDGDGNQAAIALDAKYSHLDDVGAIERLARNNEGGFSVVERKTGWESCKFNTCLAKYRDNTMSFSDNIQKMPDITSVWLLCGRHDKAQADFGPLILDMTDGHASGVMPLSNLTSNTALDRFFSLLGL